MFFSRSLTALPAQQRNVNRSLGDAACFGGMVGFGETYFAAFALAIGIGEAMAGIIASVPVMIGGVMQLMTPKLVVRFGGLKRWIVFGATIQAASFVPLVYAAFWGELSFTAIVMIASLYWTAGLSVGPAWNAWMEDVVPRDGRVRFFSHRTRLQQITTFVALMIAGGILSIATQYDRTLEAFAALFAIAGTSRLVSALLLHRTETIQVEPKHEQVDEPAVTAVADHSRVSVAKRLVVYLVSMQVFIQLSGPFFVPYMLNELKLSYSTYVCLISLAFVSKVASTGFWAKVAEKHGASRVLWFGGLGLVPLAGMWILSGNLWWIAAIQLISGFAWSAYELGMFLTLFDSLPARERTRMLTYYNFAGSIAICVGALAGAAMLSCYGCCHETYYFLFGVSSLGRLICLGLLVGIVLPKGHLKFIASRVLSVRPGAGSIVAPITASVPSHGDAASSV